MPRAVVPRKNRVTVEFEGPFFIGDNYRKIGENTREFMEQIAKWGEMRVKERLGPGRTSALYRGRVENLGGRPWRRAAVISPDTRGLSRNEAISVMAAAHELEYGHTKNRKRHDPLGRGRGKHAVSRTKAELTRWRKGLTDIIKGLT